MVGEERRQKVLAALGETPLPAGKLAERFGCSRQVIVQDIALLRAEGKEIIATNRGYILAGGRHERVFKVRHSDAQVKEELFIVADAGGCVEDVFVWHKVYGKIPAPMHIRPRRDAEAFAQKIESGVSRPLKNITGSYHYHTVSAESEAVLDDIARALSAHGFLVGEGEN